MVDLESIDDALVLGEDTLVADGECDTVGVDDETAGPVTGAANGMRSNTAMSACVASTVTSRRMRCERSAHAGRIRAAPASTSMSGARACKRAATRAGSLAPRAFIRGNVRISSSGTQ